uniref:SMP domain-containing protein n=1 Tax=Oryza meridionalis TaxID=40149 RepID=A0A0E0CUY0_9ORYZ
MSQEQPRRPSEQEQGIRYGDVFPVTGSLGAKPIVPWDAAMMQSAENLVLGKTVKGGPAAAMESAASRNQKMGVVGHDQAMDATAEQGVNVSDTLVPGGGHIVTEFVAGQVTQFVIDVSPTAVGHYVEQDDGAAVVAGVAGAAPGAVPVERRDAAAIQAAEAKATGMDTYMPGGLAAQAQSAAAANLWTARDADKTKLGDVLPNATAKLAADKEVESGDAARVAGAETRNKPGAAARLCPWSRPRASTAAMTTYGHGYNPRIDPCVSNSSCRDASAM